TGRMALHAGLQPPGVRGLSAAFTEHPLYMAGQPAEQDQAVFRLSESLRLSSRPRYWQCGQRYADRARSRTLSQVLSEQCSDGELEFASHIQIAVRGRRFGTAVQLAQRARTRSDPGDDLHH